MAETRKHRVEVRDDLDKALLAALGQPVRPATPGAPTEPGEPAASEPAAPEPDGHHTTTFVTPGTTLAGFTFGQPPARG